jgi:sRNA-binding regulator protein Hfq
MLNAVKLRLFKRAVEIKLKNGEDLDTVINSYTALNDEEKQQLREAVKNDTESN